jgi:hypothetical protein
MLAKCQRADSSFLPFGDRRPSSKPSTFAFISPILRDKIEDDPTDPKMILTEPAIGYRLTEVE